MDKTKKPILILKTGEPPSPVKAAHGDFDVWIAREMGVPAEALAVAAVYQGDALPDPERLGGVIVTGSPGMVTAREDWSEASAAWLASCVENDSVPVLGLCFGHQLMAHGLGGEVGTNPRGRELGTVEVRFAAPASAPVPAPTSGAASEPVPALGPLFEAGAFPGQMSHVESVLTLPKGATVLAETDKEPHAALQFGPRQWGVQFHPEFNREIIRGYIAARREILVEEGADPEAMSAGATESSALSRILERFAEFVAVARA
ncbi:MAG: glutamine amidotransferase [Myxococcota bacterium]